MWYDPINETDGSGGGSTVELRPFAAGMDFPVIRRWMADERAHALWCAGRFRYPLEQADFTGTLSEMARRGDVPLTAVTEDGRPAGFLCCSTDRAAGTCRLKFIIVDPALRGKGAAREMLRLAADRAFTDPAVDRVCLCVFSANARARKCYERVGFSGSGTEQGAFVFRNEAWDRCHMELDRQTWEARRMPIVRGQEWTFDTKAADYERLRPGYPEELYRTVFDYCPVDAATRAAEIGIGGGQATLPVLQTGCSVTAVELGEHFAQICREKFSAFPGFSVTVGRFEEVSLPENAFDLVYSASAFHWVPEETGYPKVYRLLKPGGAFARFAHHPFRAKNQPELGETIDRAYAKYFYPFYNREPGKIAEYSEEQAAERAEIARKYGFADTRHFLFYQTRSCPAAEYRALIGTYSDHIAMDPRVREPFYDEIEEAIRQHGGFITLGDTIDLQLARKPLARA